MKLVIFQAIQIDMSTLFKRSLNVKNISISSYSL